MNTKDFESKNVEETQKELQSQLDEYKKKVEEISDLDELKKMEEEVVAEQDEFDEYIKTVEYDLSEDAVEFEGKKYTAADIHRKIVYHLNRIEQDFQYCLGLHGLVLIWKGNPKKISYGGYDSTLRLLGGLKFKGDSEWVDILTINNYLTCAHEPYIKDRTMLVVLAEKHNAVVDRIQKCTPISAETSESK